MQQITLNNGEKLNNGRYTVIRTLGRGGFGITYASQDNDLDQKVVIKEYYPSTIAIRKDDGTVDTSPDNTALYQKGLARFLDEARILASLFEVPGVVKILDYFEENKTAYMIMEYVRGVSLRTYLEQNSDEISFDDAFNRLLPMINSLEKIHDKGLIHRDINPDNIMVQEDGSFKLLDFGSAREFFLEQDREKTMSVIVKNGYAPAEQYESHSSQGPWVDVYSLCATLYEMITGCVPMDAAARMIKDQLYPPSSFGVSITPEQEELLVKKGLAINYSDRFSSMAELRDAFTPNRTTGKKRSKMLAIIIALILAALVAAGFALVTNNQKDEQAAAGNYPRGSEEFKEFVEFVKENATDVEHKKADDLNEARTVYTLPESSVKKWGAPANHIAMEQTVDELKSFLKKHDFNTNIVKDKSACTVSVEKYGVIRTDFGHVQTLSNGKNKPAYIGYEYDVVSKKLYRIQFYLPDSDDDELYSLIADYLCTYSTGDFPVEYKSQEVRSDIMEATKLFIKNVEENGSTISSYNYPCLDVLFSISDDTLCLTLVSSSFLRTNILYEW